MIYSKLQEPTFNICFVRLIEKFPENSAVISPFCYSVQELLILPNGHMKIVWHLTDVDATY